MGGWGAGGTGAAPPESAEAAKHRVAREFDTAAKECGRTSKALQRQWHVVARAKEVLKKCEVAAAEADFQREKLEVEMCRLWGDGAAARMEGNGAVGEADVEMDAQVAAGVFAPVLGKDIGADAWVPEVARLEVAGGGGDEGGGGGSTPGKREGEAEAADDGMDLWSQAEGEHKQDKDGADWAQNINGENWAQEIDDEDGAQVGSKGGGLGLLSKGLGGKAGGGGWEG